MSEEIKKELSDFEQIHKKRSMALERSMAQIFGGSLNDTKADELRDSLLTSAAALTMLLKLGMIKGGKGVSQRQSHPKM